MKGLNNVTVDSLVQDVTPKARGQLLWHSYHVIHTSYSVSVVNHNLV